MFEKKVYVRRRNELKKRMADGNGIILFLGNVEAPAQYKDNCYKFRQDSSWLYFFGLDAPRYAAIIDLESGEECIYADDVEISDIIWMGPQPSIQSLAESVGVKRSAPYAALNAAVEKAFEGGRRVHFLPPTRYYNTMKLSKLTGWSPKKVSSVAAGEGHHASEELVKAVISMRLIKEECEIKELDAAADLGYLMHTVGRDSIEVGQIEQSIVGKMEGISLSQGWGVSFPIILTQHGEVLHNHGHNNIVEPGRLMVIDAGVESNSHYASDFTRTYPTSGKFTRKQRDIYQIVHDCNELAYSMTKPGVTYRDVHLAVAKLMLEDLRNLDIVRGNIPNMVEEGIAGLFMPHGLGHNMGLDVHDMEDLGENLVGYDPDQKRSKQLGLGSLRMARKLQPGHVITDEPGIYFIPALIEEWKKKRRDKGYVNYHKLEDYYDFGGIRLEDDILVTAKGCRRLGTKRIPIAPDDVEAAMQK